MCRATRGVLLAAGLWLLPSVAFAQAISGVVTDSSGSVLPGVTVEASSPALIEQSRTVTTDGNGRYTIISLRPGAYTVTFTLEGFTSVKREGIQLLNDFTAPINVQLEVGSRAEVIEVRAEAPLVDVQNLSRPQTMTSEMLSTVPLSTRGLNDIASRMVGVSPGGFGSGLQYRGSGDVAVTVDGNRTAYLNLFLGAGGTTTSLSPEAYSEYSFTSGIDNVDSGQGGIRINVVPKDGGNTFSGSLFTLFSGDAWGSDNIDPGKYPDVTAPAKLRKQYDVNPSIGGPIVRDKLWFQGTFRASSTDTYILNSFRDLDPDPFVVAPDPSQQTSSEQRLFSGGTRITWQATALDKVSGFYDDQNNKTPHSAGFGVVANEHPDAMGINTTPHSRNMGMKWTRTHSEHLLLEGGWSRFHVENYFDPLPGVGEAWSPRGGGVDPGKAIGQGLPIPVLEDLAIRDGTAFGLINRRIGPQPGTTTFFFPNSSISSGISRTWTANASMSYIAGSHTVRAGMTFFRGTQIAGERLVGDLALNFAFPNGPNGVPVAAGVLRYLPQYQVDNVDADWGVFVQDQWVLNRLTLKPSLRLDVLQTSFPDQRLPGSAWLEEQSCATNTAFCGRDGVKWKDLSPRLSATYDVFGDGRMAVKGGFAKYVDGDRLGVTTDMNPISNITRFSNSAWTDLNGDRTVIGPDGTYQMNEMAPVSSNFGTPVIATAYDPEVLNGWGVRRNTWETQVGVDYQVLPRLATTVFYYHRADGNIRATDNLLTDHSSFDGPFCLVAPDDPRLGSLAGSPVCDLYDITQAAQNLINVTPAAQFVTLSRNLGNGEGFKAVRDGIELTVRSNLPDGAFIMGGLDLRTDLSDTCGFSDSPENRFCRNRTRWNVLPKFSAAFTLPKIDVQASGNYTMTRGPQLTAGWTAHSTSVNGTQIDDVALAGAGGLPTLPASHVPTGLNEVAFTGGTGATRTKTVALIATGQDFMPYVHQVDMRFAKVLRFGGRRVTVGFDMYNALNASAVTTIGSTYGSTAAPSIQFRNVTRLQAPRQYKLNATFSF